MIATEPRPRAPNGLRVADAAGLPSGDLFQRMGTGPRGLTQVEAQARLLLHGGNRIERAPRRSRLRAFSSQFTHLMAILLWAGGFAAFIARMPELGIAIWLVIAINGVFGFWQEYQAERATEALLRLLPTFAHVLRDGAERRVNAEDLVPGDLLVLHAGDRVSADARVVEASGLRVDQSSLTGESRPVGKSCGGSLGVDPIEAPSLVFAGTTVLAGSGRALVYATGMSTGFGRIAHLTGTLGDELSPLQREMIIVTRVVTTIAVGCGVVFFLLARLVADLGAAQSFLFALGMIVAFVPEGLLPTVTLALALATQRMARRHALIKRLSSVETLGCTTVICTDKTGTLTENAMTVRAVRTASGVWSVTGTGYAPFGKVALAGAPAANPAEGELQELLRAACLCNDARLVPPGEDSTAWTTLGDPTEAALRVVAMKGGLDPEAESALLPRVAELPFDPARKRMTTVHEVAGGDGAWRIAYVKGGPEEVLARCTTQRIGERESPLDAASREAILGATAGFAREGMRVLALAVRTLPPTAPVLLPEAVERDLELLGLVAMLDPPRPEVPRAVATCRRAGIRVVMITGDHPLTAESVARRLGILPVDGGRVVVGRELDGMDDLALVEALKGEVIFARARPEHKLRVVQALKALGHVVAVTGDGVNDAPALKSADIGIAMGIAGTDVAKEAADIVLTDDDFASIVSAIEEGRAIYANIKKFTTYIFTSNTPEAVPFVLFAFSGGRIPLALNVMHILCIDLGTDIMPALALGAEPPEEGLMDRPPRSRKDHVVSGALLLRAYVWLGPLQATAAMAAFYFAYWTSGFRGQWLDLPDSGDLYRSATAMALAAVVTTQIGNLFAQRSEASSIFGAGGRGLWRNRLLWVGIAVELALAALIIYVPAFQGVVGTAAFPLWYWVPLLACVPLLVLADEARKAIARRRARRSP